MRSSRKAANGHGGGAGGRGVVHCAIYTRKSTDEGLDRDFNTLDAQREAAAAYVASQAGNGWLVPMIHRMRLWTSGFFLLRPAVLLAGAWFGQATAVLATGPDPAIDDFERSSLGTNWTRLGGSSAEIVNGRDLGVPNTVGCAVAWSASTFLADQFSETALAQDKPPNMLTQVYVRMRSMRQRVVDDMKIRRFAGRTQGNYIYCVVRYTQYFGRSLERLDKEHVREFQVIQSISAHSYGQPPNT